MDDGRSLRWVMAVLLYGIAVGAALGTLSCWVGAWGQFGRCASAPARVAFIALQLLWPLCAVPAFRHYLGKVRRLPGQPTSDITLLPTFLRLFRWGSEAVFLFSVLVAPLLLAVAVLAPSALVAAVGQSSYGMSGYGDFLGQALGVALGAPADWVAPAHRHPDRRGAVFGVLGDACRGGGHRA